MLNINLLVLAMYMYECMNVSVCDIVPFAMNKSQLLLFQGPTGYPSDVKIISQTSAIVTFQWRELECYEENGPITGYHYLICTDHSICSKGIVEANTTELSVSNMNMDNFRVAAINKAGTGPHSPPVPVLSLDKGTAKVEKHLHEL